MAKVLEDSLGNLEYLMQGIILVCVIILVMKAYNVNVAVSQSPKEGMLVTSAGTLGFNSISTGVTTGEGTRNGMSVSAYEAPSFHTVAYDPRELTSDAWNLMDDVNNEDGVSMAEGRVLAAARAAAAAASNKEGLRNSVPYAAVKNGMTNNNNLSKALAGL